MKTGPHECFFMGCSSRNKAEMADLMGHPSFAGTVKELDRFSGS